MVGVGHGLNMRLVTALVVAILLRLAPKTNSVTRKADRKAIGRGVQLFSLDFCALRRYFTTLVEMLQSRAMC